MYGITWPFSNKKEKKTFKVTEYAIDKKISLTLKFYEVTIYGPKNKVLGKSSISDVVILHNPSIGQYEQRHFPNAKPTSSWVETKDDQKFLNFKHFPTIHFEDENENTIVLVTDIIEKIVISELDKYKEEVQLYKTIEVEYETKD